MTRGALTAIGLLALSIGGRAAPARAFSDPERFMAPTHEGGGGGRFFTGSLSDGFTCAVCHRGGATPTVNIAGLPRTGFLPGQMVQVELSFGGLGNHSLALEMVDDAGRDLGLELLPEEQIAVTERCGAVQGARRASYLTQVGARRVLGLEACEARSVAFRFRTPQAARALFVASVLASDNSATIEGDGVTEIAQSLFQDGRSAAVASDSGCSAALPAQSGVLSSVALVALAALWRQRRSRRRRAR